MITRGCGVSSNSRYRFRKYIRRIESLTRPAPWVVEVWLPHPICKIWLGSYLSESAARQALREWVRAGCCAHQGLPAGILPKWVVRCEDGFWGVVRVGRARRVAVRLGPFPTPSAAHLAVLSCWNFVGYSGRQRSRRSASPYRLITPAASMRTF